MESEGIAMQKKSILVVDDEEMIRNFLGIALNKLGHIVHAAENGEAAVKLCSQPGTDIDLALVDLVMPGMSGPETIAQLHQHRPNLPAVLSSGGTEGDIARICKEAGAVAYLIKPYRVNQLAEVIAAALEKEKAAE
jgi:CheY-like chemotaxis protein